MPEAGRFGMWIFLGSEIMLFGALFLALSAYRVLYPEPFALASRQLELGLGALNTGVLLTSSLTMALGVRAAQLGRRRAVVGFLLVTMLLGLCFLAIKGIEYHHKWVDHLVPGTHFAYEGANWRSAQLFFIFYFVMTGLHLCHVLLGLVILCFVIRNLKGAAQPKISFVETGATYWHMVDVLWLVLFAAFYLMR
jgi:heme/copper-type cytochrome/quinol oxidase subunit 3